MSDPADDSDPPRIQESPAQTTDHTQNDKDISPDCPFCTIATHFQPIDPSPEDPNNDQAWNPDKLVPPSYVLLATEHVVAFLDIAPLTRGHVLLAPRKHRVKVGDMDASEMAELGRLLPLTTRSVIRSVLPDIPHDEADYNVVQNNGPGAAQVIPHVHFHIIPRPPLDYRPPVSSASTQKYPTAEAPTGLKRSAIQFGRGMRQELDDDEAAELVKVMRRCVAEEWRREFGGGSGTGGGPRGLVAGVGEAATARRVKRDEKL